MKFCIVFGAAFLCFAQFELPAFNSLSELDFSLKKLPETVRKSMLRAIYKLCRKTELLLDSHIFSQHTQENKSPCVRYKNRER